MAEKKKIPTHDSIKLLSNMRMKATASGEFDDRKEIQECGIGSVITGVPHNFAREMESAGKAEILPEGTHKAKIEALVRRPRSGRQEGSSMEERVAKAVVQTLLEAGVIKAPKRD